MGYLYLQRTINNGMVNRRLSPPIQQLRELPDVFLLPRRDLSINLSSKIRIRLHLIDRQHLRDLTT
jgi:hypothetical protein